MGTEVVYQCNSGYHNVGKGNVSICTAAGQWERPSVLCQGTVSVLSDHFTAFLIFRANHRTSFTIKTHLTLIDILCLSFVCIFSLLN